MPSSTDLKYLFFIAEIPHDVISAITGRIGIRYLGKGLPRTNEKMVLSYLSWTYSV